MNLLLSIGSVIPTPPTNADLVVIGKGTCGIVFEEPGTEYVWKQALEGQFDKLWHEYRVQKRVVRAFEDVKSRVFEESELPLVPEAHEYITKSPEWYEENEHRLSEKWRDVADIRKSERIFPLPEVTRHLLINTFCPESSRELAKQDPSNTPCIARVYLGKERPVRTNSVLKLKGNFTLRNFPLYIDDTVKLEIGSSVLTITKQMAVAIAICHWESRNDAKRCRVCARQFANHKKISD